MKRARETTPLRVRLACALLDLGSMAYFTGYLLIPLPT